MDWFKKWFNSPLYEKLYANRNEREAVLLADLIEGKISKPVFREILDLGCGRGRHSITFAERGYSVTGVDLSEKAISKAKQRAGKKNLDNVHFEIGDMRKPLDRTFDAVLNLFTTFGYFLEDEENRKILKSVSAMLRDEGVFVLDFLNSEQVRNEIVLNESGTYENVDYTIERKIEDDMVFKSIIFSGPALDEPIEFSERVKLYDLPWFQKNLKETGFEISEVFGDYHGNAYHKESSSRLLIFSRKMEN